MGIKINCHLCKAIDLNQDDDFRTKFLNFVERVKCCNFISNWIKKLKGDTNKWNVEGVTKPGMYSKNAARLISKNKKYIKASSCIYNELYIQQGKFYSASYV